MFFQVKDTNVVFSSKIYTFSASITLLRGSKRCGRVAQVNSPGKPLKVRGIGWRCPAENGIKLLSFCCGALFSTFCRSYPQFRETLYWERYPQLKTSKGETLYRSLSKQTHFYIAGCVFSYHNKNSHGNNLWKSRTRNWFLLWTFPPKDFTKNSNVNCHLSLPFFFVNHKITCTGLVSVTTKAHHTVLFFYSFSSFIPGWKAPNQ